MTFIGYEIVITYQPRFAFGTVFLPLVLEIPKILLLFSVYGYDR